MSDEASAGRMYTTANGQLVPRDWTLPARRRPVQLSTRRWLDYVEEHHLTMADTVPVAAILADDHCACPPDPPSVRGGRITAYPAECPRCGLRRF